MTWFWIRGILGALLGGLAGYWYFRMVGGCHSRLCIWTSSVRTSILTGGLLGWLIATGP